jgi:hypothetical protein
MKVFWYLNRLKTMSVPEIAYRIKNAIGAYIEEFRYTGYFPAPRIISPSVKILPALEAGYPVLEEKIRIFDQELDYSGKIDWHLDIKTGNRFPMIHSHKIDIRTPKYGSAKHVWEVNRMLFLPQLCLNYKKTGDPHYLKKFIFFIDSWIDDNPYLLGVNWYSNIEVNVRLLNWFLSWEILDGNELMKSDGAFNEFATQKWIPLIYLHCKHSRRHLSKYSSANNHLISELAGLYVASKVWKFKESEQWSRFSKKGLEKEIIKQHTKNGINREEAAEYIQFITDFFLICYLVGNNTCDNFSEAYTGMLKKILDYIFEFTDSRCNYPKYGDEDDGQVFRLGRDLDNNFMSLLTTGSYLFNEPKYRMKAGKIDLKSHVLLGNMLTGRKDLCNGQPFLQKSCFYTDDGHFIFRNYIQNKEVYLHFDAAPLGYLSIAAHGHADALSVILHLNGKPVLTDPGTYTYHTQAEWRKYFISTMAHNTVSINGKNQAVFGGSTLWVSHYNTKVLETGHDDTMDMVFASHDGYKKLGLRHSRRITFNRETNKIIIADTIESSHSSEFRVEIPFHISPDVMVTNIADNSYLLKQDESELHLKCDPLLTSEIITGSVDPVLGWYSESFQIIKPASVICCSKLVKHGVELTFELSILGV